MWGEKEKVGEGALCAIGKAAELIDLTRHQGSHPRIGATDVVPFIPVRNVTLQECVAIARFVGEEAARRFRIPVYLYEAAAGRADRVQLENIRKGQFERLSEEIETNPERYPDFGAPKIHPTAGATVVGARKFLIAYNINLNTPDVAIASNCPGDTPIQRWVALRQSDGRRSEIPRTCTSLDEPDGLRAELQSPEYSSSSNAKPSALASALPESEVVGLIPQAALDSAAEYYLANGKLQTGNHF